MYSSDRLIIFDADGTTIDAFAAIEKAFYVNGMDIGNLERFQKRRNLFKYLGGVKELPKTLGSQLNKKKRKKLLDTLTEIYRYEARIFDGMAEMITRLRDTADIRMGIITRNITLEPLETLHQLYWRNNIDPAGFDFLIHLPLRKEKADKFREVRVKYRINPALAYACGDEAKDYFAALQSGIFPFMVSYGFEDHKRLRYRYEIPGEIISASPAELCARLFHTLNIR
jgi:phosphoglycolate phosphatase